MKKENRKYCISRGCFRIVRGLVRLFYPKITVKGAEHLPEGGCIIVGNHTQMNGPICAELYVPGKRLTWCASQMMELKEVPAYAYADFWSGKPRWCRWFYRILSYIIAPLSACVFCNAFTIPVYRDGRLITTFRRTIAALQEGTRVVIFPEHYAPHNHIVNDFQDKFIDVARQYYKKTGACVPFVPMYVAPKLKKLYFGNPVVFRPDAPIEEERRRICDHLMDEITRIAVSLPRHRVVPYANLPKKEYPMNIAEECAYENA